MSTPKIHPGRGFATTLWLALAVVSSVTIFALVGGNGGLAVYLVILPVLLFMIALTFSYQTLSVTADSVVLRWFPLYRTVIPLHDIAQVEVTTVHPMAYGGWGLRLFRRGVALVHAGGPGIRIEIRAGREYIFTTPDPDPIMRAFAECAPETVQPSR